MQCARTAWYKIVKSVKQVGLKAVISAQKAITSMLQINSAKTAMTTRLLTYANSAHPATSVLSV